MLCFGDLEQDLFIANGMVFPYYLNFMNEQ